MRKGVSTSSAPAAIGPYSQAIDAAGMVFCSGQVGIDPTTRKLVDGIEAQTEQALRNLAAVLEAAGLSLGDVVKTGTGPIRSSRCGDSAAGSTDLD